MVGKSSVWLAVALGTVGACADAPVGLVDDVPPDEGVAMCTPTGATASWRFARLGAGAKPALAMGSDGTAHAAYMNEANEGWVRYARLAPGELAPGERLSVADGYFYGPIDIALGADGQPRILYHDHTREDQVLAEGSSTGAFELRPMVNTGHDGWYNSGIFDDGGTLHTATYDPSGFAGRGVIYGAWDGAAWTVEVAAPGSFDYAGGTGIVVGAGERSIAFFDDAAGVGRISTRSAAGSWTVSETEPLGDRDEVGRFPDIELDPDGSTVHLVYLARGGAAGDVVRYARGRPGAYDFENLTEVSDFSIGFSGARDLATLAVSSSGQPFVALQTRSRLQLLTVTGQGPQTLATFEAASGVRFMQQTDVSVDAQGQVHVVWWQSGEVPGTVCYATNG